MTLEESQSSLRVDMGTFQNAQRYDASLNVEGLIVPDVSCSSICNAKSGMFPNYGLVHMLRVRTHKL
nr:CFF_HP1_G0024710.mRNA.1.CDS.1 [Saccharomyces cerevisiae]